MECVEQGTVPCFANPLRYRGYYYDNETGLYYLQSRYYDPDLGRFISADDFFAFADETDRHHTVSLYVYCANSPLKHKDPSGYLYGEVAVGGGALGAIVATLLTWGETMSALGVTNKTLDFNVTRNVNLKKLGQNAEGAKKSNENCWGVFADSQVAAKTLAVALGAEKNCVPMGVQGGYPHYHDSKHAIHIWYGYKLK